MPPFLSGFPTQCLGQMYLVAFIQRVLDGYGPAHTKISERSAQRIFHSTDQNPQ